MRKSALGFLSVKISLIIVITMICSLPGEGETKVNNIAGVARPFILLLSEDWKHPPGLKYPLHTLAKILTKTGKFRIDRITPKQVKTDLSEYDFVIMYIHRKLPGKVEKALINYVKAGGKMIVLHHGIASSKMKNPMYLEFLGIRLYPGDHEKYPWKVLKDKTYTMVNLYPGHFITTRNIRYERLLPFATDYPESPKGTFQGFDLLTTEVFLNQRFTPDYGRTILYGLSTEKETLMQPTAGWYKQIHKGWLFYFQPGHSVPDYENPNFQHVLLNTLEWQPRLISLPWDVSRPGSASAWEQDKTNWESLLANTALDDWIEYSWPPGPPMSSDNPVPDKQQWHIDASQETLFCDSKRHTYLATRKKYRDFILHVEWRYTPEEGSHNSGILFRMHPDKYAMFQCELKESKAHLFGGYLRDSILTYLVPLYPGSNNTWQEGHKKVSKMLRPLIKTVLPVPVPEPIPVLGKSHPPRVLPMGEWNTTEILCYQQFIILWHNGSIVSYSDNCTILDGVIGFESEHHPIFFRNIWIKPFSNKK